MNPFMNMEQHRDQFTQNDMRIYRAIIAKPEQVTYLSTSRLAEELGVSQPALTRFIKMLGYQKYQEFRSDITAWLASRNVSGETGRASYFEQLEQVLKETGALFTPSYMDELTDFFLAHRRIFASGIGKSMNPALLMNHLYKKHDLFVTPCPLDGLRDTADHLGEEDLLVLFSVSASAELMDRVRSTESDVLLCTANAAHPYKNLVTKTVVFPYLTPDPELSSISPVLFDVFVELLDRCLTERTASDTQKKENRK